MPFSLKRMPIMEFTATCIPVWSPNLITPAETLFPNEVTFLSTKGHDFQYILSGEHSSTHNTGPAINKSTRWPWYTAFYISIVTSHVTLNPDHASAFKELLSQQCGGFLNTINSLRKVRTLLNLNSITKPTFNVIYIWTIKFSYKLKHDL